jgi:hypothetical protein
MTDLMTKPTIVENFLDYCDTVFEYKVDTRLLRGVLTDYLQTNLEYFNFSKDDIIAIAEICNEQYGRDIKTDNFIDVKPSDFLTEHKVFMLKWDNEKATKKPTKKPQSVAKLFFGDLA